MIDWFKSLDSFLLMFYSLPLWALFAGLCLSYLSRNLNSQGLKTDLGVRLVLSLWLL
jgi:hypothetical protein